MQNESGTGSCGGQPLITLDGEMAFQFKRRLAQILILLFYYRLNFLYKPGFKEETLTCKNGVSDVSNVGYDTPKPPVDCSNEMGEAIVIGAQKIHDNNTNTNNLDFIFTPNPLQDLYSLHCLHS